MYPFLIDNQSDDKSVPLAQEYMSTLQLKLQLLHQFLKLSQMKQNETNDSRRQK
jgi:hypothetical protein